MNQIKRKGVHFVLAAYLLTPLILPGCVLVVEDDHDRRDRLHGTSWYLEVVFYRTQSFTTDSRDVQLAFVDDTRFEGTSSCGAFAGTYRLDDQDAVSIESFDANATGCEPVGAEAVFLDQFVQAERLTLESDVLRITTRDSNALVFSGQ